MKLSVLFIISFAFNCYATRFNRPNLQKRPIVGGVDAHITSIPYQVSLGVLWEYENEMSYSHFCGGSVISVEWVLTAAHCVKRDRDDPSRIESLRVRAGSHIKTEGGSLHKVARIVYHPGFDMEKLDKDVAVIKVKEPFEFGPTIQPIQLTKYPLVPGGIATVSGWGTTSKYGDSPTRLQKVQIPIMAQWECEMHYKADNITDKMFCAGRAGRNSCNGDSGGAVVYNGFQIGIVSWGRSCQRPDYPVVYTSVLNMRDWIHKYSGV